jgi:hypothetical protein
MKPKTEEGLRALLEQSTQTISINDFKTKYDEELYIFLEPELKIVETAVLIVKDDTTSIQTHIDSGSLKKLPTAGLESLPEETQVKFVIVQPYTLFQLVSGEKS